MARGKLEIPKEQVAEFCRRHHIHKTGAVRVAMIDGKTRADLDSDRKMNLALVRLLEVVGEAASRMPADERSQYPQIPWSQIVALRNRLIHGYDSVDFDVLWQILNQDLPR